MIKEKMIEKIRILPALPKLVMSVDRPGWIPAALENNWDTDPYAYQTEEELMPAGGLHGQILAYIMEVLRSPLAERGMMLLMDTFLLYRDEKRIKQRIAPDLLLMPLRTDPPSAYDLDKEAPPLCVVEVTSPKSLHTNKKTKVAFYFDLGISTYLVIDAVSASGKRRRPVQLHLWRAQTGSKDEVKPDKQGGFSLPELGMRVHAEGQDFYYEFI